MASGRGHDPTLRALQSATDGLGPHAFLPPVAPIDEFAAPLAGHVAACRELPPRYDHAADDVGPWLAARFASWSSDQQAALAGLDARARDGFMTAVCTLAHTSRWGRLPPPPGRHRIAGVTLPPGIAEPLTWLSDQLGVAPCGNLYHLVLNNWRRPGLPGGASYPELALQTAPEHGGAWPLYGWLLAPRDRELAEFVHGVLETEVHGADALRTLVSLAGAAVDGDSFEAAFLFDQLHASLERIGQVFARVYRAQRIAPDTFMAAIQPHLLWGLGEGDARLDGASGAQTPSIAALDAGLAVPRDSPTGRALLRARGFLPPAHRRALAALDVVGPTLRAFAASDPGLRERYNACLHALLFWRRVHQKRGAHFLRGDAHDYMSVSGMVTRPGIDPAATFEAAMDAHVDETAGALLEPAHRSPPTLRDAFPYLDDDDLARLLAHATTHRLDPGELVLAERSRRQGLFVVREGAALVRRVHLGSAVDLAELRPGALFGELSFLQNAGASASVVAGPEGCALDVIEPGPIFALLDEPAFAARFFQSLATSLAARLRQTSAGVVPLLDRVERGLARPRMPHVEGLTGHVYTDSDLRARLAALDRRFAALSAALDAGALDEDAAAPAIAGACDDLLTAVRSAPPAARDALLPIALRWLLPSPLLARLFCSAAPGRLLDMSTWTCLTGPVGGDGALARCVDRWARALPTLRALAGLPARIAALLRDEAAARPGPLALLLTDFGPAWHAPACTPELALQVTCVDFSRELQPRAEHLSPRTRFCHEDLTRVAAGHAALELPPQQVACVDAMVHRLDDRDAAAVLTWLYRRLAPDGLALVVAVDPAAPDAPLWRDVLQLPWRGRGADALSELFTRAEFGADPVRIESLAGAVHLALCRKRPRGA